MYRSKHFLQGRAKPEKYSVFYERFARCIVGKRIFSRRIDKETEGEELCSPSDEALALIALENGEENWVDLFIKSKGQIRPVSRNEARPPEWSSEKPKKWTTRRDENGNIIDTSDRQWGADAIERFNDIRQWVILDRKKHPEFVMNWVRDYKTRRDQEKNATAKKLRRASKVRMVEAHDDLFTNLAPETSAPLNMIGVELEEDEDEDLLDPGQQASV